MAVAHKREWSPFWLLSLEWSPIGLLSIEFDTLRLLVPIRCWRMFVSIDGAALSLCVNSCALVKVLTWNLFDCSGKLSWTRNLLKLKNTTNTAVLHRVLTESTHIMVIFSWLFILVVNNANTRWFLRILSEQLISEKIIRTLNSEWLYKNSTIWHNFVQHVLVLEFTPWRFLFWDKTVVNNYCVQKCMF